jgi:predicted phage replisome organizer
MGADSRKYYYLKLKENFFDQDEIKIIKGLPKGDTYIAIMLELYLKSLKRCGTLRMTDTIPFEISTLASVLGRDIDELKFAIDLFVKFKLITIFENGDIYMNDIETFIGKSSTEADRKRRSRLAVKAKEETIGQMADKCPTEIDTEIEKKLELQDGALSSGKIPSLRDVEVFCGERGDKVPSKRFFNYYQARGWKIGGDIIDDWKALLVSWEESDESPEKIDSNYAEKFYKRAEAAQKDNEKSAEKLKQYQDMRDDALEKFSNLPHQEQEELMFKKYGKDRDFALGDIGRAVVAMEKFYPEHEG